MKAWTMPSELDADMRDARVVELVKNRQRRSLGRPICFSRREHDAFYVGAVVRGCVTVADRQGRL